MAIQISGVSMGVLTGGPSSITLADLADVSIVTPLTGQYLRYNASISEWQNTYINPDVYSYLNTDMTGSNGVAITYTPGPNTIGIALSLSATGDATGSVSAGSLPLTLATVNSNVGSFGSATQVPVFTVNAKGLITAVTNTPITAATSATNLAGGSTNQIPYQTGAGATSFYSASNYGVQSYGATGVPASIAGVAGVLQGSASAIPAFTTTPILTGTNFTGIPNAALTNNSLTVGSTNIALGGTSTTITGLTSVTSTTFVGALTGNATTATALATGRVISATGDATGASAAFNGTTAASIPLTLATVNSNVGTFAVSTINAKGLVTAAANLSGDITSSGAISTLASVNGSPQTDQFRKITINGKGLTTATSAVVASDITTALTFTPVNKAGDTMTGLLVLSADPGAALGAATKQYVDNVASGLNIHNACVAATTANLSATYNNGASGVGATLTANPAVTLPTIDGVALSVNNRVLIKNQTTQTQNGIYVVTQTSSPWILTRADDFDNSPAAEVQAGDTTFIQSGTANSTTQWVMITTGTITIGTSNIVFTQFGGPGTYTGGSGINVAGTVISNTGVLSLTSNTGLSTNVSATGAVTVTNTGVLSVAGTANQITTSASTGAITLSLPTTITGLTSVTSTTFVGALTGNATTATTLQTARTIGISGGVTGTATSFNGSANITIPITAMDASSLTTGTLPDARLSGTYTGLTSVTSTTFVGALTGNASTVTTNANLTGDVTSSGNATTLATVATGATTGSSTAIPVITFNNKGLVTAITTAAVIAPAGTLSGATLAAGVTASSLTSVGTVTSGTWSGLFGAVSGANLTTLNASNLSSGTVPDARLSGSYTGLTSVTSTTFVGALTGNATTATTATNSTNSAITNDTTTNATMYPTWVTGTSGNLPTKVSSTKLSFNPSSGILTSVAFNATSTKRVKKAIKNLGKTYLSKFADLRPREYDRKDYKAHEFGFVAEEMALVYPEIVGMDDSGIPSGIDYGRLSAILTAKVQEQESTISKLQKQVAEIMGMLKGVK